MPSHRLDTAASTIVSARRAIEAAADGLVPRYSALEALTLLTAAAEDVQEAAHEAARMALANGATYAEVGNALGLTRQAARARYAS